MLGACYGYAPHGCGREGFANDNIFFLEACLYSEICSNREELFAIPAGGFFTCRLDPTGLSRLRGLLVGANGGGGAAQIIQR